MAARTTPARMPEAKTTLILQEFEPWSTRSTALAANRDESIRAAITAAARLSSPICFERTTALISMKADSVLDADLLPTHGLHDNTKWPI